MNITKQQLKQIIKEEYARTLAEGDVPRHRVSYREYQHLLDAMMEPVGAIVSKHGLDAALFVIDAAVEELKDQFAIKADNPYA